jgi:multiple RNA-binding domain-containing protein 1
MVEPVQETPTTDSDWLRARTSRTLGLISDSENSENEANEQSDDDDMSNDENSRNQHDPASTTPPDTDPSDTEQAPSSKLSTTESKILKTGRLFIRNLVYGVTEDDLREVFSPFGQIEEVSSP